MTNECLRERQIPTKSCHIRFKFRTFPHLELSKKHAQSLTVGTLKGKHFVQVRVKYLVYAWIKFEVEVGHAVEAKIIRLSFSPREF
jgi:hypothetical protein